MWLLRGHRPVERLDLGEALGGIADLGDHALELVRR